MFHVKAPRDLGAAIAFITIGTCGLYFGSNLTYGSAAQMGPGYFPRLLSLFIIAIGAAVGLKSFAKDGEAIEPPKLRPILFVLLSLVAFGYLVNFVGLALAGVALVLIAAYARRGVNLAQTLAFGIVLSLATVAVFVYGLGQPLPAWWGSY